MEAAVKIPMTRSELLELGIGLVKFPATWEEYWEMLGKVEYNIEYQNEDLRWSNKSGQVNKIVNPHFNFSTVPFHQYFFSKKPSERGGFLEKKYHPCPILFDQNRSSNRIGLKYPIEECFRTVL